MARSIFHWLSFSVAAAFVVTACSDDSDSGAEAFAADYCQLLMPCCAKSGLSADPGTCTQVVQFSLMGGFDEGKGNACLSGMRSVPQDDAYCADVLDVPACESVFPQPAGSVQPGGSCVEASDCATTSEGRGMCVHSSTEPGAGDVCLAYQVGGEGAGPCVGEKFGALTVFSPPQPPPLAGYVCDGKQDLYCNHTDHLCKSKGQPGDPCSYESPCTDSARCDDDGGGHCVKRNETGDSCAYSSECVSDAYCNQGICADRLPPGSPCTSDECDGNCVDDKCELAPDLGYMFICLG